MKVVYNLRITAASISVAESKIDSGTSHELGEGTYVLTLSEMIPYVLTPIPASKAMTFLKNIGKNLTAQSILMKLLSE
jgi:hypothetical protein